VTSRVALLFLPLVVGCHRDLAIDDHRWLCANNADCDLSFECDPTIGECIPSATDGGALDGGYATIIVTDEKGMMYAVDQGPPGPPAMIGCADGRREGLLDLSRFPAIAACIGSWTSTVSLRDPPSGVPCGNDLGPCNTPADVCAAGWTICASSGDVAELTSRLTASECDSAGGYRYTAAVSHCAQAQANTCPKMPGTSNPCWGDRWCGEPVCCGAACSRMNVCKNGVYLMDTHVAYLHKGCATVPPQASGGVLCCQ
jgi:hypothetical protein